SPGTVPADGATHADATALVTDAFGNPIAGDPLSVTTSGDVSIGSVTDHGDGSYTATITASATYDDELITAHDGLLEDTKTLTETSLAQTITFPNPGTRTYGDAPFASGATSDSGLTVTLTSSTPGVCNVSGLDITILAAGTCSIDAGQPGDAQYAAATTVTQQFDVDPAATTTAVATDAPSAVYGQNVTFTATVSSAAGVPSGNVVF